MSGVTDFDCVAADRDLAGRDRRRWTGVAVCTRGGSNFVLRTRTVARRLGADARTPQHLNALEKAYIVFMCHLMWCCHLSRPCAASAAASTPALVEPAQHCSQSPAPNSTANMAPTLTSSAMMLPDGGFARVQARLLARPSAFDAATFDCGRRNDHSAAACHGDRRVWAAASCLPARRGRLERRSGPAAQHAPLRATPAGARPLTASPLAPQQLYYNILGRAACDWWGFFFFFLFHCELLSKADLQCATWHTTACTAKICVAELG